jgi:epidermal growth factor receptor substrate 15
MKSKLPVEKLAQIWLVPACPICKSSFPFHRTLADTQDRGALDPTDFTIAMHLIRAAMSGQLTIIPTSLPPGLYQEAGGGGVVAHPGGPGTSSFLATVKQPPIQPHFRGQRNIAPPLPPRPGPANHFPAVPPFPGVASQETGQWDVTLAEKASADRVFDALDSHKRGVIEGDVVAPFMLQSKLSAEVLAQVWYVRYSSPLFRYNITFSMQGSRRHQP